MRRTFLLKSMLLLCALVAGSSNVWADEVYYTFTTAANSSNNAYASTYDVTISGLDWNVPGNQYADGGLRIGGKGGKNSTSVSTFNRIITGKSKMGAAVTKITFNHGGVSNANCVVNSVTLTVASKSDFSDGVDYELTPSFSLNTDGSFDFTPTSPATEFAKDSYYKFTINQTITGSSNFFLLVKSIVFYKESSSTEPSITLGSNTVNATADAVSTTSIEVTYNNLTNYDADVIFYEADGTTKASYDHSWLTAEINSSTKNLDYSITANNGAARTAYLRVYALGEEGETESSLITITQAAKPVAAPTFNPEGGSYMQGTGITLTSEGNTIYYNLTTDGSTPATPTNASTEYTAPIVLGSGTTKITAIAYDTYGNASSTTTRTYTGIAPTSLPFSWTGTSSAGKDDLAAKTGVTVNLSNDYAVENAPYRLKFDAVGKNVTIFTNGKPETLYFTAKIFNASSSTKMKVQASTNGVEFRDVQEFEVTGSANATFEFITTTSFDATDRVIKLMMSSKQSGVNVAVGTICVSCIPIKPAKTYTTLTSAYALDFTNVEGLKAFIVEDDDASDGKITMTQVNKVPAGTGLVLKATTPNAAVSVPVFDGTGADDVSENKMAGSATEATEIAANAGYILKDGEFHPATAGTLAAGKAYLKIAVANGNAPLAIDFDGETTGINMVNGSGFMVNGSEVYNLNGQRVAQPTKGLYIVNGRKVVVK